MNIDLKINFCSHDAAKYACQKFHYNKSIPSGKLFKIGIWENDEFMGCIIYSRGANPYLLKPYNLEQTEGCELTRIAMKGHQTPLSKILSVSIKILKKYNLNLRLIVSFADSRQEHLGIIYQATNWIYTGNSEICEEFYYKGRWVHKKTITSKYKYKDFPPDLKRRKSSNKLRYLMPLDKKMRKQIELLRKPYPKDFKSVNGEKISHPESIGK